MTSNQANDNEFWRTLIRDLTNQPLQLSVEEDSFYTQPEWTVHRMHYVGLNGYPLFAWVSIPRHPADCTPPALLCMPDYGSVQDITYTPLRHNAIVMNATHRGQRHSDSGFQAQYPGLLTEGIDRQETFVMLRVFADAIRAVDALLSWIGEDTTRPLVLTGSGLGGALALATATLYPRAKGVAADTPLALGHPRAIYGTAYPLAEMADYLRVYPHRRDAMLASTVPLNPVALAPNVHAVEHRKDHRDPGLQE